MELLFVLGCSNSESINDFKELEEVGVLEECFLIEKKMYKEYSHLHKEVLKDPGYCGSFVHNIYSLNFYKTSFNFSNGSCKTFLAENYKKTWVVFNKDSIHHIDLINIMLYLTENTYF